MIMYKISIIINTLCDGCKAIINRGKSELISSVSNVPINNSNGSCKYQNNSSSKTNTKGLCKTKIREGKER